MPQISVIVPVYKVENFIRRCVDSILNQTYTDFELILVDDGSPDNCGRICDEYAEKDGRVVVIHQENGGLSAARNAGIDWAFENSDSEWITFIDSDDWVHKDYLLQLYNAANENGVDISVCSYKKIEKYVPDEDIDESCIVLTPEELWMSDRVNSIVAVVKLYKKALWKEIRYPVGKLHEDEFTTYKLLFVCDRIAYLNYSLYYYFQNSNSITHNWSTRNIDVVSAIENQMSFFKLNGHKKAFKATVIPYFYSLHTCLLGLEGSNERESKLYNTLWQKYRRTLFKYKLLLNINSKYHPDYYILAFPRIFPIQQKLKKKSKRALKVLKAYGFFGVIKQMFKRLK